MESKSAEKKIKEGLEEKLHRELQYSEMAGIMNLWVKMGRPIFAKFIDAYAIYNMSQCIKTSTERERALAWIIDRLR